AVHGERDHHLAVSRMIDGHRFQEFRRAIQRRLVQAAEADLYRAGLYAGAVEHILEAHAAPQRVAHRTVRPLRAGDAWFGVEARSASALADRGYLETRHAQNIFDRERQRLVDHPAHLEPEGANINLARA